MPPDEKLVDRVRSALSRSRVEEKRMFGGLAFMVEGKMCVTVGHAGIMCRIDPAVYDAALERNGCTTVVMKGREYRGYVRVAAEALNTERELAYWVGLALEFNSRARASKKTAINSRR